MQLSYSPFWKKIYKNSPLHAKKNRNTNATEREHHTVKSESNRFLWLTISVYGSNNNRVFISKKPVP